MKYETRGRKRAKEKYRSIAYVTPKGYKFAGKKGNKLVFVKDE